MKRSVSCLWTLAKTHNVYPTNNPFTFIFSHVLLNSPSLSASLCTHARNSGDISRVAFSLGTLLFSLPLASHAWREKEREREDKRKTNLQTTAHNGNEKHPRSNQEIRLPCRCRLRSPSTACGARALRDNVFGHPAMPVDDSCAHSMRPPLPASAAFPFFHVFPLFRPPPGLRCGPVQ